MNARMHDKLSELAAHVKIRRLDSKKLRAKLFRRIPDLDCEAFRATEIIVASAAACYGDQRARQFDSELGQDGGERSKAKRTVNVQTNKPVREPVTQPQFGFHVRLKAFFIRRSLRLVLVSHFMGWGALPGAPHSSKTSSKSAASERRQPSQLHSSALPSSHSTTPCSGTG